jgi:hypothetical protein
MTIHIGLLSGNVMDIAFYLIRSIFCQRSKRNHSNFVAIHPTQMPKFDIQDVFCIIFPFPISPRYVVLYVDMWMLMVTYHISSLLWTLCIGY